MSMVTLLAQFKPFYHSTSITPIMRIPITSSHPRQSNSSMLSLSNHILITRCSHPVEFLAVFDHPSKSINRGWLPSYAPLWRTAARLSSQLNSNILDQEVTPTRVLALPCAVNSQIYQCDNNCTRGSGHPPPISIYGFHTAQRREVAAIEAPAVTCPCSGKLLK